MKNKLASLAKNLFLALGITAISSSLPVAAVTLNSSDVGKTFEIDWFLGAGEGDIKNRESSIDLSANGRFELTDFSDSSLSLDVTLTNNTDLNGLESAGITKFGFAATPEVTGVDLRDNTYKFKGATFEQKQNASGTFRHTDICIFTKERSDGKCGGNQTTALAAGETDNFYLDIYGDFTEGVTFSKFPVRFKTSETHENNFSLKGIASIPEDNTIAEVPEPGMIVAIGLFTASSLLLKKRQRV